ncbi:hypothetical protein Peur_072097 [Populus x canadensis]|jgi:translation initiation factor 2 subunit 2
MVDNINLKDEVAELAPLDPTRKKKEEEGQVIHENANGSMESLAEKTESVSVSDR